MAPGVCYNNIVYASCITLTDTPSLISSRSYRNRINNLRLNVFFTPSAIIPGEPASNHVYIVIDVIRATTTLAVMFEQGAARVLVAETIEQAETAAYSHPRWLLCG